MRNQQDAKHKKRSPIRTAALGLREEYPPEEFAGFEIFGESPEWHPGQAGCGDERVSGDQVEIIVE